MPTPPLRTGHPARAVLAACVALAAAGVACSSRAAPLATATALAVGTWGGQNAAVLVSDTLAHVHVGCTYGNFPAPIRLDASGRLDAAGSYMLRAYPIAVGPSVPAELSGVVTGTTLTFTVVVTDTVEKRTVTLGPATVTLGKEPQMGPCPICRTPRAMP